MKLLERTSTALIRSYKSTEKNLWFLAASREAGNKKVRMQENSFLCGFDVCAYRSALAKNSAQKNGVIKNADLITHGYFTILGSRRLCTNENGKVEWHKDFKSGTQWERETPFYKTVIFKNDGSDIKMLWELSRFNYLPTLCKAYHISGDEKYAEAAAQLINDWLAENPKFCGPNWACPMEAGIRAVNFLWAFRLFKGSKVIGEKFFAKLASTLHEHGKFIRANLERNVKGINNNHYITNLVSLIFIGSCLNHCSEAKEWRKYALDELFKDVSKQVYDDGVHYEGSIRYHCLVTEMLLQTAILEISNGNTLPDSFLSRLCLMIKFIECCAKGDGSLPQINDDDGGRFVILNGYGENPQTPVSDIAVLARHLYGDIFSFPPEPRPAETELLLPKIQTRYKADVDTKRNVSQAYHKGGFYIMRSDTMQIIADCVNVNRKCPVGHKHNGRLSFELCCSGVDFIIDSGTYTYSASVGQRQYFRSTKAHNTITVDGKEQNEFLAGEFFNLKRQSEVCVKRWHYDADYDFLDAEHYGYKRPQIEVTHRRRFMLSKEDNLLVILDDVSGAGNHSLKLNFHLAPHEINFDEKQQSVKAESENIKMLILPMEISDLKGCLEYSWHSPYYGKKERGITLSYVKEGLTPVSFCTVISLSKDDEDLQVVKAKARHMMNRFLDNQEGE